VRERGRAIREGGRGGTGILIVRHAASPFAWRLFQHLDERLQLILVGAVVGVCSALAAVLLTRGLGWGTDLLRPLRAHPYAFLLPACGAGLSVLVLRRIFREVGGHGVSEVIYAISRREGLLRFRSAFSRLASSLLTIASGGSAGPEGPIVISGASIGARISCFFNLNHRQRTVIVASGAGGAIAAIFNAPMAGMVFALEAILGSWAPIHLIPIAISSVTATEVSRLLAGNQIPFEHRFYAAGIADLGACLPLAIACAAAAILFSRLLRMVERGAERILRPPALRAAAGGMLVGLIALGAPMVAGEGYEWIRFSIEGSLRAGLVIAAIALGCKILGTALTLGSGGSGGVFAPALLIGSLVGVVFCRLVGPALPDGSPEGMYALFGMAGVLSAVLQSPLTACLLVMEITGSYELVLPALLVSVISSTLSQRFEPYSVYHQELAARGGLLRPRTDARVMAELSVMELLDPPGPILHPGQPLREVAELLATTDRHCFAVVDPETEVFLGTLEVDAIRSLLFDPNLRATILVEEVMDAERTPVSPGCDLADIMDRFRAGEVEFLPVVQGRRFLGYISKMRALEQYRKELIVQEEL